MSQAEKRIHTRSQYFLIKSEGQPLPVYAFRDENDLSAVPALVVDLSEGGVQVLTTQDTVLDSNGYELEIANPDGEQNQLERINVKKVWQKRDGLNTRTGFAFQGGADHHQRLAELISHAEHHLLRCVLHPVGV
jgi:hypothetical protein